MLILVKLDLCHDQGVINGFGDSRFTNSDIELINL